MNVVVFGTCGVGVKYTFVSTNYFIILVQHCCYCCCCCTHLNTMKEEEEGKNWYIFAS